MVSKGIYNPKLKLPLIPLSDGAGEVVAVGAGVTRFHAGDRVVAGFMPEWVDGPPTRRRPARRWAPTSTACWPSRSSCPSTGLLPIPSHLSFEEAATLPCAAVTAWNALVETGGIKPGDTVLVQGTGGVSLFALQFARLAGARVIATSSSDAETGPRPRAGGRLTASITRRPPTGTSGSASSPAEKGSTRSSRSAARALLPQSMRAVRLGGYIALIGVLSGAGDFNPMPILMKNIRLQGIFVGSRAMFEAMIRAIEVSQLHPVIDRVFRVRPGRRGTQVSGERRPFRQGGDRRLNPKGVTFV